MNIDQTVNVKSITEKKLHMKYPLKKNHLKS